MKPLEQMSVAELRRINFTEGGPVAMFAFDELARRNKLLEEAAKALYDHMGTKFSDDAEYSLWEALGVALIANRGEV